ncbi:MAG: MFS transporter, partial [Roseibium sp.]
LVYCTCSLEKAEGEDQIAGVLAERDGIELIPVTADEIGGLTASVTEEGYLRTLPCQPVTKTGDETGLDGFFAARIKRL